MHCALCIDHIFFLTCPIFLKTQVCDFNFELILKQTQNAIGTHQNACLNRAQV